MAEARYADLVEGSAPAGADWDDFRILVEVVRTGSFNKAAAKLNMTQPTVSRRLMRLEEVVGVRLFERDRRGPRLTTEGLRIYNDASAAHVALARAASPLPPKVEGKRGECRLLIGEGLATYWISRFLGAFFARHPDIDLKLVGSNEVAREGAVQCDLFVHYYEPATPQNDSLPLGAIHFMPFASRDYLARCGVPRTAADLGKHTLLDQAVSLTDVGTWAHWLRHEHKTHTSLFTNLSAALAEAVLHGAGVAIMPSYAAAIDERYVPIELGMVFPAPFFIRSAPAAAERWDVCAVRDFLTRYVFDAAHMPWFGASFALPERAWAEQAAALIAAAAPRQASPAAAPEAVMA